ncbi:MAG: spondin domain-containing protein [Phycisphaerales bacterium JB047]
MLGRSLSTSLLILCLPAAHAAAQDAAEYRFEFAAEWSEETHPTMFPNNPHFSRVIGATHTDQLSIWAPNGIATFGIEDMAERGAVAALQAEVDAHIAAGTADQFLSLRGIPTSPDVRDDAFVANADYPLLSIVTMIAPSPDWFVGIHDVDLRPGGVWVRELVFDLYPYDSGTDAGVNFVGPNIDITPHLPILNIADQFPFEGTGRLGTFRITLTSEAACSLADFAEPYETLDFFDVSAFINAFVAQDQAADLNGDSMFNFFDVSAFLNTFSAGCP